MRPLDRPVIFLDFDGVLNSEPWILRITGGATELPLSDAGFMRQLVDPTKVALLQQLVDATGAQIVVSSSWREELGLIELQDILSSKGLSSELVDTTPLGMTRRRAIETWLRAHPETWYVVLDDFDLGSWPEHVRTDPQVGLTEADTMRAIEVLHRRGRP